MTIPYLDDEKNYASRRVVGRKRTWFSSVIPQCTKLCDVKTVDHVVQANVPCAACSNTVKTVYQSMGVAVSWEELC